MGAKGKMLVVEVFLWDIVKKSEIRRNLLGVIIIIIVLKRRSLPLQKRRN